jgi:hypothetical protein
MRTTIYQPGRTPNNWELFIPPIKMVMTGRWCKIDIVLPISLYLHTILHIPYICIKQHYTIYIYHLYTYITVYPINIYIHTTYNCSSISHVALPTFVYVFLCVFLGQMVGKSPSPWSRGLQRLQQRLRARPGIVQRSHPQKMGFRMVISGDFMGFNH